MLQRNGKHKAVTLTSRIAGADGRVVEQNDLPIGDVHGVDSDLFPKIEASLDGHLGGDRVEVAVAPDEGFEAHHPALICIDELADAHPGFRRPGAQVTNDITAGRF